MQRRVKLLLVVVAWVVQVFSTAQLANTVVSSWVLGDLPYTWQWAVVQLPLAAVGIAAVVLAYRSLWFDTPQTGRGVRHPSRCARLRGVFLGARVVGPVLDAPAARGFAH